MFVIIKVMLIYAMLICQGIVFFSLLFMPIIENWWSKRTRCEIVKLIGYQTFYIHVHNSKVSSWYTIPQASHDAEMIYKGFNNYLEADRFMKDYIR